MRNLWRQWRALAFTAVVVAGLAADQAVPSFSRWMSSHQLTAGVIVSAVFLGMTYWVVEHLLEDRDRRTWRRVAAVPLAALGRDIGHVTQLIAAAAVAYRDPAREGPLSPDHFSGCRYAIEELERKVHAQQALLTASPDMGIYYAALLEFAARAKEIALKIQPATRPPPMRYHAGAKGPVPVPDPFEDTAAFERSVEALAAQFASVLPRTTKLCSWEEQVIGCMPADAAWTWSRLP